MIETPLHRAALSDSQASAISASAALDATAIRALDEANYWSLKINREYAGHLCRTVGDEYEWSDPNFGRFADEVIPSNCRKGTEPVGRYHTHGRDGQQGPSDIDISNANALPKLVFYVITPCYSVHSWQGPNAAFNQRTLRGCK